MTLGLETPRRKRRRVAIASRDEICRLLQPGKHASRLAQLEHGRTADDDVFQSESNRRTNEKRYLSPRTAERAVAKAREIAGIKKNLTPHSLRPGYVTLELPPLENWSPTLNKLPSNVRERIQEPDFYQVLQSAITRRMLQPAPQPSSLGPAE